MDTAENVTITREEYETLKRETAKLAALEAGGVDNWEWYGEALADFWDDKDDG